MHRVALLLALALLSFAGSASAQSVPGGTWRETCRDPYMRGDTLTALCMTRDGQWRESRIDAGDCRGGGIENDNGRLNCASGGGWGGRRAGGSYLATCRDVRQDGPMIRARCQDQDGEWRTSRIDARDCRNDIANIDGRLACFDRR
ncbi:CVNH domain-containing protein [Roseiterribacter gracilis]|uniref:Cyanovirin-N domain-containing protein n=1 Tax=Roseiterribacter gracilis TaxID=2812848 RepID=A0A8S8XA59_9PROT|nr:hypothetical protein TMPK1_04640 [Rhodospirillales bacterium TMPK1]